MAANLAWTLATVAASIALKAEPLPSGISECRIGDWKVRLNNGTEARDGLPPFGISMAHDEFIRFAILEPSGGAVAGYGEDALIAELTAFLPPPLADAMLAERSKP